MQEEEIKKAIKEILTEEGFLRTDTRIAEIFKKAAKEINLPCGIHDRQIKSIQDKQETANGKIDETCRVVNKIYNRFFVGEDDISFFEDYRNLKGLFRRHIENHGKITLGWKTLLPLIGSFLLSLTAIGFSTSKPEEKKIDQKQMEQIIKQIIITAAKMKPGN
jgi:hypothetical protein